MSDELPGKLAERLEAASNSQLNSRERWEVVADTIQLMIDKAIFLNERRAADTEVKRE